MKVTKKIITSVLWLIASLTCCVWACFAWFSSTKNVSTNGMEFGVGSAGFVNKEMNIYTLSGADTGTSIAGAELTITGLSSSSTMPSYGDITVENTAILVELVFEYDGDTTGQTFKASANTTTDNVVKTNYLSTVDNIKNYQNYLSNVVEFYTLTTAPTAVNGSILNSKITLSKTSQAFFSPLQSTTKNSSVDIVNNISVTGNSAAVYLVVDYSTVNMAYLYSNAEVYSGTDDTKTVGLELTAAVKFESDITFTIEKS